MVTNDQTKADFNRRLNLYQSGLPFHNDSRLASRALALLQTGNFAEAEPLARECVTLREKMMPDNWLTFNARSILGGSLLGQKKYSEAEPLLLSGYEGIKQREDKLPQTPGIDSRRPVNVWCSSTRQPTAPLERRKVRRQIEHLERQ